MNAEADYSGPYHPRLSPIQWLHWSDERWTVRGVDELDPWTPEDHREKSPGGLGRLGDATIVIRAARDRTLWGCKVCGGLWLQPATCHDQKSYLVQTGEQWTVVTMIMFDGFEKHLSFESSAKYPQTERATDLARDVVALHQIAWYPRPWITLTADEIERIASMTSPVARPDATWPASVAWVAERVKTLRPDELPKTPWALHSSATKPINGSTFFGGSYLQVTNNETFLAGLKLDVSAGPQGPRRHVIETDLLAMERVLRQRDPAKSFGF